MLRPFWVEFVKTLQPRIKECPVFRLLEHVRETLGSPCVTRFWGESMLKLSYALKHFHIKANISELNLLTHGAHIQCADCWTHRYNQTQIPKEFRIAVPSIPTLKENNCLQR